MSLFRSKHRITQEFGVNKEYYSKFGLIGHEGIDVVPTGTDWTVYALLDGVVVKDEDNARSGAYGIYCTIWSPQVSEALQYAHMEFNLVEPGMQVKKGQAIGKMGSTGNSTGPHVHLNRFKTDENGVRLNRDNGYLGGIDPKERLEETQSEVVNNDKQKAVQFDKITSFLNSISILPTDRSEDYINNDGLLHGVQNLDSENKRKAEEINKLNEQIDGYISEKAELQKAVVACQTEKEILSRAANEDAIHDRDAELKNIDLEKEIQELKKEKVAPLDPVIEHYEPILDEFWKNLFKGKRTKSWTEKFWAWIR